MKLDLKLESKLKLSAACVIAVMSLAAVGPYLLNTKVRGVLADLKAASTAERQYATLLTLLGDAETGERGYVITGRQEFLQPYSAALGLMPALQVQLRGRDGDAAERLVLGRIDTLTQAKLASMAEVIRVRDTEGFAAARRLVDGGSGKSHMDQLRHLIGDQVADYALRRSELRETLTSAADRAAGFSSIATVADIALILAVLLAANRGLTQRLDAERRANAASELLREAGAVVQRRNVQLLGGAEMLQALELAGSADESARIVARFFRRLLPALSGSLYLYRNSRDILERKASWGDADDPETVEPCDCWALRKGSVHDGGAAHAMHCGHCAEPPADNGIGIGIVGGSAARLCVPLITQGNVIGFITLQGAVASAAEGADERAWAGQLAEQAALALSNVELRVSLRLQSVIDPLTQLYNRRYLDETLKRELTRAERRAAPLALLMIDLDHFKRVNDSHGHEAGDLLLRSVAAILKQAVRACDVACRYGGEELVVVMPDCELDKAAERAEQIRTAIAGLRLSFNDAVLTVTASLGVAGYPASGYGAAMLVQEADAALYAAKHGGRDRVVVAAACRRAAA